MKINAINNLISKAFYKNERIRLGYYYGENTIGVAVDGRVVYFIPVNQFIFDKDKLLNGNDCLNLNCVFDENEYHHGTRSNVLLEVDESVLATFENEKIYMDIKLLKHFDKGCTYKVKNPASPILVYEQDKLVGLVLPVKYNPENC